MNQSDNRKAISLSRFVGEFLIYSIVVAVLLDFIQSFVTELIQNSITNSIVLLVVSLIINVIFLWITYVFIFKLIFKKYKVKASEIDKFKKIMLLILTISSVVLLISRIYRIWTVAKIAIAFFGEKFFLYAYFIEVGAIIISLVINVAIANFLFTKNVNNLNNVINDQESVNSGIFKLTTVITLFLIGIVTIISGILLGI